jgi:hypothetical protein
MVNGLEVSHTEAHNLWFSDMNNLDNISIGSIREATPAYADIVFKHLSIFSTPLTDAESADYANYLNKKHE